jgi:cell division protein FtsI (penicillin-binding protein 3)
LADLIYATDPSFHEVLDQPLLAEAERHLPTAMNGARGELVMLYDMLGIPYEDNSDGEDWVKVKTGAESVTISSKTFVNKAIPDVRGMGLRDALYLLENAGVKVLYKGTGIVKTQSITPGTRLNNMNTIRIELS